MTEVAKKVITAALRAAGVPVADGDDEQSDHDGAVSHGGSESELNKSKDDAPSSDDGLGKLNNYPMKLRATLQAESHTRKHTGKATQPAPSIPDARLEESDSSLGSDMEHLITAPLHKSVVHQASAVTPKVFPPPAPAASAERISTRAQCHQAEIPVWTQPEEPSTMTTEADSREGHHMDTTPQHHKSDNNPDNEELHQTNSAQTALPVPWWMPDTHIKLNTRGQVNIRDHQPHIQAMLRTSISLVLHHIAFKDSFPDMNHTWRTVTDLLYVAANQMAGCEHVRSRLVQDAQYVHVLSSVSSRRISKAHTAVKVVAQQHVASVYQLEKGCSAEKINVLLQRNMFIFPMDSNPWNSNPQQALPVACNHLHHTRRFLS
ncbi:hypothetical protein PAXRUDRAFT_779191 [Paxillus rubicundulus Ve08.2h10]|uniref:DUF6532 domain-containing protein n=1 Tax=Paxillus rubicundulus Ve08.2h10 TaxID=930991 RepID=A0A0D0C1G2_9AGAM|nr:hypothetical protein PAXRUDRAFT_779191 [Paxillus rubicundulus Ve08.2h10]